MPPRSARRFLPAFVASVAFLSAIPSPAASTDVADAMLAGLQWRLVGPFRGGWSTMAAGIADQPGTFYFGTAGGGVWKTTNAGATWESTSEGITDAAIGAIAIAPSNPKVLYAGAGHPEPRYDIASGNGVYKTMDGGAHWQNVGLKATRHIGAILIDPRDENTVLVGALGHIFGPSPDRGVFRTTDGGTTWKKTLFVDNQTGVSDLAADPAHPNIVFASAWTARDWPWLSYFTPIEGEGSAIYASQDAGLTWKRLNGEGWPKGKLGRIGLAVTHLKSDATRIYASIDSEEHGGLYRSDDAGAHWQKVNDAKAVSTWYESRLTVAPNDPDTLYTVGQSIHKSTDAGKTFTIFKGAPGGDDYHYVWINPKHPNHIITASDQGTVVSVDDGAHWSDWYNQPTGQFYHLATDNRFPYWIYSGQQDSGTVGIASRSDYGAISFRDWHPVGGDERDYDIPDPEDPNIVYGSGLGSRISRWDSRTGEVQNVSPWPVSAYGARPTDVKYRYTWISPIAFSAHAPYAFYAGTQVLFRSNDKGQHWDIISPDLTGKRDGAKHCDGDVPIANATACGYGVIYSIAPSPRSNDEIWIGTDNGRIQMTANGGKRWNDVTPKSIPAWSRIDSLDLSALEPGTAYAAVDNHRQDDFRPMAVRTHDNGKTWTKIANGLPDGHFVAVVRADPLRKGLLYAGTDAGVYVSFDDGDRWQPLQQQPSRRVGARPARARQRPHRRDARPRDLGARRRVAAAPARRKRREHRRASLRTRARVSPAREPEQGHAAACGHGARHESADRRDHRLHARQVGEAGRHRDSREERRRRRQAARRPTLRQRRQDAADQGRTLLRASVDETRRETVNRTRRAPLRLEPALAAAEGGRIQLFDRGRVGRGHAADAGRCAGVAGRLRRCADRRWAGIASDADGCA